MPPTLAQSSVRAASRYRCLNASGHPRSFSTTSSLSAIGPESPKFIEIPTTLQPQVVPKKALKGVLPVPRNLFPSRGGDKTSNKYFAATIPKPKTRTAPANDYVKWKTQMATMRRTNLREGLQTLQKRKDLADFKIADRSFRKSKERERRVHMPQLEVDRLTNPTIIAATSQLNSGAVPDPRRQIRIDGIREKLKAKELAREEARRDALHTLYMHARSFITTEDQLDNEINKIFIEKPFPPHAQTNIWDALGSPPSVQEMLSEVNHTQKTAVAFHRGPAHITGVRLKKIAEALTGGKMESRRS